MPERPFFASKLFFSEIATDLRFYHLSRDDFLCFAGFLCEDLLCIRRETG